MEQKLLNDIICSHELWLNGVSSGKYADLSSRALINADLSCANLTKANLACTDLRHADLRGTNLTGVDLTRADLRDANLTGANLTGAKLIDVEYNHRTVFYALQCPEVGAFTAFKKCGNYIVELVIPKDAKRSSATTRKCRADKAKVVAIYTLNRTISNLDKVASVYDNTFLYKVGKTVKVKDFDENRWNECSTGVHFFLTFEEAAQY